MAVTRAAGTDRVTGSVPLRPNKPIRLVSPKGNWNGIMSETGSAPGALTIVGPGRAGSSIASAARRAGIDVELTGRSPDPGVLSGACVLLCVPDAAIAGTAAAIGRAGAPPRHIGHTSGATTLDPLSAAGASEGRFSIHPLQTLPDGASDLAGAPAAVAGSDPRARALAASLAGSLGMKPFAIDEADRALYHAAASMASNFLVTLEQNASRLLSDSGVEDPRAVLAPLVRRTLENWIADGPEALTGPIARGDEATVRRHREAIAEARPDLVAFYDALATATRTMAGKETQEVLR
jgi:predicted short-subunit dehydrogenase-like oxidoreductase (DUF2520 family)